jgi:PAS domain-containing protein
LTPNQSKNGRRDGSVRRAGDKFGSDGRAREANGDGPRQGKAGNGERRREELADFLRTKRSILQPEDVGLPDGSRRRTPGLRREEVALLAGVGTTWYTWLEQGRDVRASLDVLEAVARALQLTSAERAHLILLGRGEQAPPCKAPAEKVSPTLRRLVENTGPGPVYLLGRRWDYLAWNKSFERVFGWGPGSDPLSRNHVWLWFMDPAWRALYSGDWATSARLVVAKFRADSARNIGDPAFEELTSALNSSSPEFRKLWKRHEVAGSGDGRKELKHPLVGHLVFDHAVFTHGEAGDQRLVMYSPACEQDTQAKLVQLLQDEREPDLAPVAG